MVFEPIDIAVTRASDTEFWVSLSSKYGAVHGVAVQIKPAELQELDSAVQVFRTRVKTGQPDQEFQRSLGKRLMELVFSERESLTLFQRTRGAASANGVPLLVRVLATPASAAALPWELMLDPEPGPQQFLTLAPDAHLTRLARARTARIDTRPLPPPLRMLLILSSPSYGIDAELGLAFDIYEEKRALLAELQPLVDRGLLEVDVEDRPTVEALRHRIARRPRGYHMVHYIGHATTAKGLLLEDEQGYCDPTPPNRFIDLLRACPDLRLIFFAGCETAQLPDQTLNSDGLGPSRWPMSIADVCVRDASPIVLGMQALLSFRTEKVFSRYFYEALVCGRTVADAITIARSGVYNDQQVGQGRLDWAVPALIIAGESPVSIVDTSRPPRPPVQRIHREELKLDIREEDRDFFARHLPLRIAVDFLAGRTRYRVLWITGRAELDKVAFAARALEDVGDALDFVLLIHANRLVHQSGDPILTMCKLVTELLTKRDGKRRTIGDLEPADWWDRLIDEVVSRPFAIVISDVDHLPPSMAQKIKPVLTKLIARKRARLVISSSAPTGIFEAEFDRFMQTITLEPLIWQDVEQWIQRHRPGLPNAFESVLLQDPGFRRLGERLDLWNKLADRVDQDQSSGGNGVDLDEAITRLLADDQGPRSKRPKPTAQALKHAPSKGAAAKRAGAGRASSKVAKDRLRTTLRVAVAGIHIRDGNSFAAAITQLANREKIGGRMLGVEEEGAAPIAELVPLDSPFKNSGGALLRDIFIWWNAAIERDADIILADFGSANPSLPMEHVLKTSEELNILVITAGSNDQTPMFPAWDPKAFGVGPLEADGQPLDTALWDPELRKPDIFAPWSVKGTLLEPAVNDANAVGSSLAALNAVAAAILVWTTNRQLKATEVRNILVQTAAEVPRQERAKFSNGAAKRSAKGQGGRLPKDSAVQPRALSLPAALLAARKGVLLNALKRGPLEIGQLIAASGLRASIVTQVADSLVDDGQVRRTIGSEGEVYDVSQ